MQLVVLNVQVDKKAKRCEINVPEDAKLLLSVGELNKNKNHQVIIRAIAKLNDDSIHYAIAGIGDKKDFLLELAKELGVKEQVHLLGYRKDVPELKYVSDVFCFPSHREGLGVAAIEAMACGLPIITSNIHGINDYSENDVTGYKCSPDDVEQFANFISILIANLDLGKHISEYNKQRSHMYDVNIIVQKMKEVYELE